jgi:hypothetical protein
VSEENATQEIKVGDMVAYSKPFLKSAGWYTGDMLQAKGQVTALVRVGKITFVEVAWTAPDLPAGRVNVKNLRTVKQIMHD